MCSHLESSVHRATNRKRSREPATCLGCRRLKRKCDGSRCERNVSDTASDVQLHGESVAIPNVARLVTDDLGVPEHGFGELFTQPYLPTLADFLIYGCSSFASLEGQPRILIDPTLTSTFISITDPTVRPPSLSDRESTISNFVPLLVLFGTCRLDVGNGINLPTGSSNLIILYADYFQKSSALSFALRPNLSPCRLTSCTHEKVPSPQIWIKSK